MFDTVADRDYLGFGAGSHFDPKRVSDVLDLRDNEVSKMTSVPKESIHYDDLPVEVREHLEQIATTVNMVAGMFDGNTEKTVLWFKTKNPLLGDVSPRDMVRLGRFDRLRKFIIRAMSERPTQRPLVSG